MCQRGIALAVGSIALFATLFPTAHAPAADLGNLSSPAQEQLVAVRRLSDCLVAPTEDVGQELLFRGRPAIEVKGRERGGDQPGTMRDLAVFDPAAGRVVSYLCFANASTRKRGEAIISLAEISSRADKLARAILGDANLELESVKRYLPGETDSVYYEANYLAATGEFPFFEPPVRLVFNASSGGLFRLDVDPDWLDPATPPRVRISRKSAERIAQVVLRNRDFVPAFGPGAVFGSVAAAEIFTVRPNDWLGYFNESSQARARVAWVVPFRVAGGTAAGLHNLFVDAATGIVLGGQFTRAAEPPPR